MRTVMIVWVYLSYDDKEVCAQGIWDISECTTHAKRHALAVHINDAMGAWFEFQRDVHGPEGKAEYLFDELAGPSDMVDAIVASQSDIPLYDRRRFEDRRVHIKPVGGDDGR